MTPTVITQLNAISSFFIDPLFLIDFYKSGHIYQYPDKTDWVYSNLTPRSFKHAPKGFNFKRIVWFGGTFFIKHILLDLFERNFFQRDIEVICEEYTSLMDASLYPGAVKTDHIRELHALGYLPLEICALPEGSCVGPNVPVLTIHNTLPKFFWLVNYLETVLSNTLWKMCTAATIAAGYRSILDQYSLDTIGHTGFCQYQGHDFSFRGMGGYMDGIMTSSGHMLSFVGTDTVPVIPFLEHFYGANRKKELIGCSVPASEHSVMCMGSKDGEFETFKRFVTEIYPKGIVSIVSDTWDLWKVLTDYLPRLKDEILARDGKLVIRPDSGDPVDIVCGTVWGKIDESDTRNSPKELGVVRLLARTFGTTTNAKGYKELNAKVGCIYGDSITPERAVNILERLRNNGFAANNIVFGIGSYTYTHVTRDTFGFAVKATAGSIDGQFQEIFKDPATDNGLKKSAKGRLSVIRRGPGEYLLLDQATPELMAASALKPIFRDGKLLVQPTLSEIRARVLEEFNA